MKQMLDPEKSRMASGFNSSRVSSTDGFPAARSNGTPKLLIVEDDEALRAQMSLALRGEYLVAVAENRAAAVQVFESERPALVVLDLGLPPAAWGVEEGFAALREFLRLDPNAKVIVVTGRGEPENGRNAVANGAYDFFSKPYNLDELKMVLRRASHLHALEEENRILEKRARGEAFAQMLGTSKPMQDVFAMIRKVATTDAAVLILGESGTGKELAARAIHQESARREGPFVPINCGAIPDTLLESELFGHERGAFSGAHMQRKGRFELAHAGTLFLDEIGELPFPLQVKLLRFLQERQIERVGGREPIAIDTRVITATNRDLKSAIGEGRFREDLYFRLSVVTMKLPPLRERGEDIVLLAKLLLDRYAAEAHKTVKGFTEPARKALRAYPWPGNVRELENRVKRAVIMADGPRVTPVDLELHEELAAHRPVTLRQARERAEKQLIEGALARHAGNLTQVAADLGISRPTLYDLLEKHNLTR
jgi:two-component system NtrC family response regulator